MKILVLSTNGILRDGISAWISQYFTQISSPDVQVHTISTSEIPDDISQEFQKFGIVNHIIPSRKKHVLRYLKSLWQITRQNKYDIVHINGNSALVSLDLIASFGSPKAVRIVHSHNTQCEHPKLDKALRPLMYLLTTKNFACGKEAGRWLFGKRNFTIINNGRNFQDFSFSSPNRMKYRSILGIENDNTVIGHIGNFTRQKNHKFLIDSFAVSYKLNPKLRLFLVGDGPLREEAESQISSLGLSKVVTLLGTSREVPSLLSAFDLVVLPSLHEGFPNVIVESQINGLPALISSTVTDECALTDLVTIVQAGDSKLWGEAMAGVQVVAREYESVRSQNILKQAGFEVASGSTRLLNLYQQYLSRTDD